MELDDFIRRHRPALEASEAAYNLILGALGQPRAEQLRLWSLGPPGACAFQHPDYAIVLGALDRAQCRRLAEDTAALGYPGVVGNDDTASWFVERAGELGLGFAAPIPQMIHALDVAPRYPGATGAARPVGAADAALFADWMLAFLEEAVPHDPRPPRSRLEATAGDGRHLFWTVDGQPVSIAGIVRRTRHGAAIAGVYTPPKERGRGYAGSVTAAVVERIFAEGGRMACLYTDLRNPISNRCYARIGFRPVCASAHYLRQPNPSPPR